MISSPANQSFEHRNQFSSYGAELHRLPAALRYRPLEHFVRPSDPCVPKQLLGNTLEEVAALAYDDLLRLSGVGPVKIANLLALLRRIIAEPAEESLPADPGHVPAAATLWNEIPTPPAAQLVEPKPAGVYAQVDELLWEHWCVRIRRWGLEHETLGRCVARLRDLPRSLWFVPVEDFLYVSYGELFRLRGFGVKRVAAIVEVFRALDAAIETAERAQRDGDLAAVPSAVPPRIAAIDAAVRAVVLGRFAWCATWFENTIVQGLWEQIQIDADETTCALVAEKLGREMESPSPHVRLRIQGLSRTHRFGILTEAGAMVQARWPDGEALVGKLLRFAAQQRLPSPADEPAVATAIALFFPDLKGSLGGSKRRRNPDPGNLWIGGGDMAAVQ